MTISGGGISRIFRVNKIYPVSNGSTVLLSALKLVDGYTEDSGGAIFNEGDLTLRDSILTGNTAQSNGGAVLNSASTIYEYDEYTRARGSASLTINNSTITNNTAGGDGGAVSNSASQGIYSYYHNRYFFGVANLTINNSTITGNTAGGRGGVVANNRAYQSVTEQNISNSTISGNASGGDGGAISIHSFQASGHDLTINNSTISGNTSSGNGGAISISKVYYSRAFATINNSTISGNASVGGGGAIANITLGSRVRDYLVVRNSTLSGNAAGFGVGGIENRAFGGYGIPHALEVQNTTIYANKGGGIGGRGDVLLNSSVITGSTGGADLTGVSVSGVANFIGDTMGDPLLGPLSDNGGPTETHLPLSGSPLIYAGANPLGLAYDQRGAPFIRTNGGGTDIGSVEVSSITDTDADGIADREDNCILKPNGTKIPDAGGNSQRDTDGDGYGNVCDPDLTNDLNIDFADLAELKSVFFTSDPDAEFNADGSVDFADLAVMKAMFFGPPGPSGLVP